MMKLVFFFLGEAVVFGMGSSLSFSVSHSPFLLPPLIVSSSFQILCMPDVFLVDP